MKLVQKFWGCMSIPISKPHLINSQSYVDIHFVSTLILLFRPVRAPGSTNSECSLIGPPIRALSQSLFGSANRRKFSAGVFWRGHQRGNVDKDRGYDVQEPPYELFFRGKGFICDSEAFSVAGYRPGGP